MKVEIWSDVACPWCYIGKRRFESALGSFGHRDAVEIVWRSFQLDPEAPQVAQESHDELLAKKFGVSEAQVAQMNAQLSGLAAKEGLEYRFDLLKSSNTFDAHRLIHLAATHGLQGEMKESLMHAYWSKGLALWDTEAMVKIAEQVGLDADEARATLESDAYADEVRADLERAHMFGINGVPFFVFDEKYGVSGAQPAETFGKVLEQVWTESHPLVRVGADNPDAGVCVDGSCAI
jgi:predicted DsbA family dithiol-disulfide isomerase